ncbi:MAG: pyridoxal-phosphate dependent enzyme [Bacteroidetes bacterium]|nr:pyridoxal-phosphate dependent enzyme [Bacteroidota bacterium]
MNKYHYKCFDCGKSYDKDEIEKNLIYLCPTCGKVEKNKPLRGVLLINYDYEWIRKNHSADEILKLQPGKFWQYDYLWPLEFTRSHSEERRDEGSHVNKVRDSSFVFSGLTQNDLNKISLPSNYLLEYSFNGNNFFVLDDTRNPTLSFKDRASSLVVLKAMQLGIKKIAAASTGNAGSSLAGICARLGLKSVVFVPKNIPDAKRIQIQSYGAELVIVNGDYDLAFDTCLEVSQSKKLYNRNTAYNPLTIEGKKSAAYDLFISTKGKLPDIIFVPVGDGVIISGLYKGLWELKELGWIEKIPKLVAVQAKGSNAVVKYFKTNKFVYKPAESIADSICAGAPRALYLAHDAIVKSGGDAMDVTDKEILNAQKFVAQNFGMLIEPSSAAAFAGYKKYLSAKKLGSQIPLVMFTGQGLKDLSALSMWNKNLGSLISKQNIKSKKKK